MKKNKLVQSIILNYAKSFVIMYITDVSAQLVDALIVSNGIGANGMAAVGLSSPSFKLALLLSGVLALGMQLLCSEAMSAGDRPMLEKVFSSGWTAALGVTVLLSVCCLSFVEPLAHLLGASETDGEVYTMLCSYLRGWFIGIPGFMIYWVLSPIAILDGRKRSVVLVAATQTAINIIGDLLSVTVLKLGIWGVGLFTGLGWNVCSLILLIGFFGKRSSFRLRLSVPDGKLMLRMLKMGTPKLTKYGCRMLAPILINNMIMSVGGSAAMAAMALEMEILDFCLTVTNGIGESVSLMSQVFSTERDHPSLRQMAKTSALLLTGANLVIAALLVALAMPLTGLFLHSGGDEFNLSVLALGCLGISLPFRGVNYLIFSYLQGTRKTFFSNLHTVGSMLVSPVLSTFIFSRSFGTYGLFWAIPVAELLLLACYDILVRGMAHKHRWKADRLDCLMMIDPAAFPEASDCLEFSVRTAEEVSAVSVQIDAFLAEKGMEHRRRMLTALCAEEMTSNIVEHGFTKDEKPHHCSIRILTENGDTTLRLRDDCVYFDLRKRYESLKDRDITSGVGIRMVYRIAKEVVYVNILNTNTVYIRI